MKRGKVAIFILVPLFGGLGAWLFLQNPSGVESGSAGDRSDRAKRAGAEVAQVGSIAQPNASEKVPSSRWLEALKTAPQRITSVIDPGLDRAGRLAAARSLPSDLATAEVAALLAFLSEPLPEDDEQSGHALKNDVMDALIRQDTLELRVIEAMSAIFRDDRHNVVIRDYAVQHLALAHERLATDNQASSEAGDNMRSRIMGWLWQAVDEGDGSISGTALMGLARLSEMDETIDRNRLQATAVGLASSPAAGVEARISALQVAGTIGATEILPAAVDLASTGQSQVLRLSAIGTIGLLGGRSHVDLLNEIAGQDNRMLRPAAIAASTRISNRLSTLKTNPAENP